VTTEEIINHVAGTDICTCLGCARCSGEPCSALYYDGGAVCVWCSSRGKKKAWRKNSESAVR
jgi:hypothetical protein